MSEFIRPHGEWSADVRQWERRALESVVPLTVRSGAGRIVVGTGVLVVGTGETFGWHGRRSPAARRGTRESAIVTARHVIEQIDNAIDAGAAFETLTPPSRGARSRAIPLRASRFVSHSDLAADLAWIVPPTAIVNELHRGRRFLHLAARQLPSTDPSSRYLVVGYPTEQGLVDLDLEPPDYLGLMSGSYRGDRSVASEPVDPDLHLLLALDEGAAPRSLQGMSGSPVWEVSPRGLGRWAGIQTSVLPRRWIRATRVSSLLNESFRPRP
ncbi:MAG: hypothetical protein AAF488_17790 [Planctomycetota bacterium]